MEQFQIKSLIDATEVINSLLMNEYKAIKNGITRDDFERKTDLFHRYIMLKSFFNKKQPKDGAKNSNTII